MYAENSQKMPSLSYYPVHILPLSLSLYLLHHIIRQMLVNLKYMKTFKENERQMPKLVSHLMSHVNCIWEEGEILSCNAGGVKNQSSELLQ